MHTIAVYGTLKKNQPNHDFLLGANFLGESIIYGFEMRSLGPFPAIFESKDPTSTVVVELYDVDNATLDSIDRLEGYLPESETQSLYLRRAVSVEDFGPAWVYIFADSGTMHSFKPINNWPV